MSYNDNYILSLLYSLSDNSPYRATKSHVVASAQFKILYPNKTDVPFVLDVIPQYKKKKK
jgi:hypothetical protein